MMQSMELTRLCSGEIVLRPIEGRDLDALAAIVMAPGLREWWGFVESEETMRHDLMSEDEDSGAFAIEVDGEIAGWLGVWEEDEPDLRFGGADIMLAAKYHGRGIGPRALRMAIDWLIEARGHHRVTIDPAADNARAIRAYEKVGFRPVGIMRQYAKGPDGTWQDALLMDLLAEELE
jgi:aminoglycoside 6'-N-acetyltransferase